MTERRFYLGLEFAGMFNEVTAKVFLLKSYFSYSYFLISFGSGNGNVQSGRRSKVVMEW